MTINIKKIVLLLAVLSSSTAFATLQVLDNKALQQVAGQGGADILLDMRLNMTTLGPTANTAAAAVAAASGATSTCSAATSVDALKCRMGIAVRHTDSTGAFDNNKSFWMSFKGISGGIFIPKLGIDGSDVNFTSDGGGGGATGSTWQSALKLSFGGSASKIFINNFGFQALSIDDYQGSGTDIGYRNYSTYVTGTSNATVYDNGKEKGILGMNAWGSVAVNGSVKMFSCGGDHLRC